MINPTQDKIKIYFFIGLFLLVTWFLSMLFKPFVGVITIAAIFAVVLYPWYQKLTPLMFGKKGLAALVMVVLTVLVVLAPFAIIGQQIFNETKDVYQYLSSAQGFKVAELPQPVQEFLQTFAPEFNLEFSSYIKTLAGWLLGNLGHIFSSTVEIIVGIFLVLVSLYFFLKDGARFKEWVTKISPLDDEYDDKIFSSLRQIIHAVVIGTLAVALVQGVLVGLGLLIFGVPNVTLWGMVAALSAMIPAIGTGLVTVPAVVYLFFSGQTSAAIGLAIWSVVLVGLVDNILLPFFYSRGNHVHPLLILFAVLGGLIAFGPVGFLLGPIILSIFLALVQIYEMLIKATNK